MNARSILHIDGDAFFASCEQSADPRLKGMPVVTGRERGMAIAVSYEAKALGIKRGDLIHNIKRDHPSCVVVPSHYELYERFSKRMLEVVRRYTPSVEEYSVDECFADLSDAYKNYSMTSREIAQHIKHDIELELGMTFSVGIGPTKVLAKTASTKNKPSGFVYMSRHNHIQILKETQVGDVWGIGRQTAIKLQTHGVRTAYDFIQKDVRWVEKHFSKPFALLWHELRGRSVIPLNIEVKTSFDSISKTHSFTPPTNDPTFLFAQLSRNIEGACRKARAYKLAADRATIFLKTKDYIYHTVEIRLPNATHDPSVFITEARKHFLRIWKKEVVYRTTGVTLLRLSKHNAQMSLFETGASQKDGVYEAIDRLSKKYGSGTVYIGSSMAAMAKKIPRSIDSPYVDTFFIPVVVDMSRRIYVPLQGSV